MNQKDIILRRLVINLLEIKSKHKIKNFDMKKLNIAIGVLNFIILSIMLISFSSDSNGEYGDKKTTYQVGPWNIPTHLNFAGEAVPMNDIDVKERFDKEMLINTFWHSATLLNIKKTNRYFPIIEPILKKHGIPEDFKYLAVIESGLDPNIKSPAGALGVWQIMKVTGKELGLEINSEVDERKHIEKSTEAACKYLNKAYKKFNSWTLVASSYNAGVSRINKQLVKQEADNYYDLYLNSETSRYLFRILALKEVLNNPNKYGFKYSKRDLYPTYKTKEVEIKEGIQNLPKWAKENGTTYKMLKVLNPWLKEPYITNSSKKTYKIKLPA